MPADMTQDVFADLKYGKAAYAKIENRNPNFRFYIVERLGSAPKFNGGLKLVGCEFRHSARGTSKGKLTIKVPHTEQTVYLSTAELEALPS